MRLPNSPVVVIANSHQIGYFVMWVKVTQIRKRIAGLEEQIAEHEAKLQDERDKHNLNERDIAHWEKEIKGWREQVRQLKQRLPEKQRKENNHGQN